MHGKHHNPRTATVTFDLLADAERTRVKARVPAKLVSQGLRAACSVNRRTTTTPPRALNRLPADWPSLRWILPFLRSCGFPMPIATTIWLTRPLRRVGNDRTPVVSRRAADCCICRALQRSTRLHPRSSDASPASGLALPEAKEQRITERSAACSGSGPSP